MKEKKELQDKSDKTVARHDTQSTGITRYYRNIDQDNKEAHSFIRKFKRIFFLLAKLWSTMNSYYFWWRFTLLSLLEDNLVISC